MQRFKPSQIKFATLRMRGLLCRHGLDLRQAKEFSALWIDWQLAGRSKQQFTDVLKGFLAGVQVAQPERPGLPGEVTGAELRVARLVVKGLCSKEIADRLNVSDLTVNNHRVNLRKKMGLTRCDSLQDHLRRYAA
jgi:DNA-binding CsgD family transcriptional regulator